MNKKRNVILFGTLFALILSGCGTTQKSESRHENQAKTSSIVKKGAKVEDNKTLSNAFHDELNGFSTIESNVKKGDYNSAQTLANKLHDEFHAAILPALVQKKGETYAESIHSKYDELQDAIKNKNSTKISQLIKVNRDNLHTVAKILGVSI